MKDFLKDRAELLVVVLVVAGLMGAAFGLAVGMRGGSPRAPIAETAREAARMALDRVEAAERRK